MKLSVGDVVEVYVDVEVSSRTRHMDPAADKLIVGKQLWNACDI